MKHPAGPLIHGTSRGIELRYAIPPYAPSEVALANANYLRVSDAYQEVVGRLADEKELARVEIAKAHSEAAAARVAGTKSTADPAKVEEKVERKLASLQAEVEVLATAADDAGNALCDKVEEYRDEWMPALVEAEAEAVDRLTRGLAMAKAALTDLGAARQGPTWLSSFVSKKAKRGDVSQFVGQKVTIDTTWQAAGLNFDSYTDPGKLIDLVGKAAQPPAPPKPRKIDPALQPSRR